MAEFVDKVVWITGAGSGIGRAVARMFAADGATLVLIGRRADKLKDVKDEACAGGAKAEVLVLDVCRRGEVEAAAAGLIARHRRVDVLVNNAGLNVRGRKLAVLTGEDWDQVMQTNLTGAFNMIHAVLPAMRRQQDGLIVNISSIAGFTGTGSNLAYVAAKASIDVVGDALAKAFAPLVRVISVSPGVVDSTFVPGRGADFNEKVAGTIPLKRIGTVDDVAAVVQACATTMRYVTGTRIVVDGGRHL